MAVRGCGGMLLVAVVALLCTATAHTSDHQALPRNEVLSAPAGNIDPVVANSSNQEPWRDCEVAADEHERNAPSFEEHTKLATKALRRAQIRNSKPVMMGKMLPAVTKIAGASSFLEMSAAPGIISQAGNTLGAIATAYEQSMGKWSYGHCVCEACHNIMEQLQVKMFSEYGYDFSDADIHDVLEDSFCDHVLPYYRSPCQYILSYRYHSLASMVLYMIPYDICQTQRMCMGTPGPSLAHDTQKRA